jgi:hypothetical protein
MGWMECLDLQISKRLAHNCFAAQSSRQELSRKRLLRYLQHARLPPAFALYLLRRPALVDRTVNIGHFDSIASGNVGSPRARSGTALREETQLTWRWKLFEQLGASPQ